MKPEEAQLLRQVLSAQPVASLATLHRGAPAVSMVPFALLAGAPDAADPAVHFVIHVSRLAPHTADLAEQPAVGLMVMGLPHQADTPLALPRLSVAGQARVLAREDSRYAAARAAYVARLPDSEELFSFADFSLVLIEPRSLRWVAGFGRAMALAPADLAAALRGDGPP